MQNKKLQQAKYIMKQSKNNFKTMEKIMHLYGQVSEYSTTDKIEIREIIEEHKQAMLNTDIVHSFEIRKGEKLVAGLYATEMKKYVEVHIMAVKKSQQSKGYGSALISEIKKLCDSVNKPFVIIVCHNEYDDVIEFYKKNGIDCEIERCSESTYLCNQESYSKIERDNTIKHSIMGIDVDRFNQMVKSIFAKVA
ncbi:GNAT family N-acetyltransferase [Vibrio parahaemolyticus]|uniref:GNAT family N-acetyltransferase n=1 Tax=Vibrio parahaemolyticus TaxID=670 RepID=UPI0013763A61|nr:GNAT family N-acetyltransferase [Vibrio parahaemolyticus]MBM5246068.1 GNAT family N-acetyltransferase [Vibrio parahaemolyticus]MBM5253419.1 GNAT family N-acetyltransferase [Vibrio parahaemolyticus]MBM5299187.1 GNAT family N-acetyltransferase [Vibrio parahaemolyticus]MBM5302748.1 GNAT family N-acetyltransferase [Vibrio parahaemolyticus]MBM5305784.1 GNAT family N-acetyltransferase [Vibrio parahaemolyticus]